jgi:hypothetical protein
MDHALDHIRRVPREQITFSWFRSTFKHDHGLKDALLFGHVVIDTPAMLGQYLHTYGPMIESQWENTVPLLADIDPPVTLFDYGCGQGLAGLLVNDLTGGQLLASIRNVVLVEPSALALARAAALYRQIAPNATVTAICKRFDDLHQTDIPPTAHGATLHLFSNSLDVTGFDPLSLLSKTLRPGAHTLVSVSHDRDFNGGTPRIVAVKAAFEDPAVAVGVTLRESTLTRFTCDNPSRSEGIAWLCEFEVEDG